MDPKMIRNGKVVTYINLLISEGPSSTESEFSWSCGVAFPKLVSFPVLSCIKDKLVVLKTVSSILLRIYNKQWKSVLVSHAPLGSESEEKTTKVDTFYHNSHMTPLFSFKCHIIILISFLNNQTIILLYTIINYPLRAAYFKKYSCFTLITKPTNFISFTWHCFFV